MSIIRAVSRLSVVALIPIVCGCDYSGRGDTRTKSAGGTDPKCWSSEPINEAVQGEPGTPWKVVSDCFADPSVRTRLPKGRVIAKLCIDETGHVVAVHLVEGTSFQEVNNCLNERLALLTFDPALEEGKPVPSIAVFSINID